MGESRRADWGHRTGRTSGKATRQAAVGAARGILGEAAAGTPPGGPETSQVPGAAGQEGGQEGAGVISFPGVPK